MPVALITGASGGLGKFVTEAFLQAGYEVAGVSRSIKIEEFPGYHNFRALPAELGSLDAAKAVVEKAGPVQVLVHVMGGWAGGQAVADSGDAEWGKMMSMNLESAFHIYRAVVPGMRGAGGGRIIAVGSKSAVEPAAMSGAYNASKAGLVALTRTVALEEKAHGITANVVLPGTMDTAANRAAMPGADYSQWVKPADVASLILWLASPAGAAVTGAAIPVYGQS